jgi:drug/metabolite transporter (DMT)-like permease
MQPSREAPAANTGAAGVSSNRIWKTSLVTALVVLSSVAGNAFLSWGMKHVPASAALPLPEFFLPFLSPFVWLGIALLIVWMLSRMMLLTWADLSFVVPVTSLGYVLNVAAGAVLLGESVDAKRWIGALLIVTGSVLTGLTIGQQSNVHRTGEPAPLSREEGP